MSEKRANFNSWFFKALFTFPIKRFAPFSMIPSKTKYSEYWKNFLLASTRRRLWYDMWVRNTHHNNIVYAETIEREREMKCESKWIMFACGACYYIFLPYIHCCCVMIEQLMKNPFSIFLFFLFLISLDILTGLSIMHMKNAFTLSKMHHQSDGRREGVRTRNEIEIDAMAIAN